MKNKRLLFVISAFFLILGMLLGFYGGFIAGRNVGIDIATTAYDENSKAYEQCASKEEVEIDLNLSPTFPVLSSVVKNEQYKTTIPFKGLDSMYTNKNFKSDTKKIYKVTTQHKDESGNVIQSTYTVNKNTYDAIKSGEDICIINGKVELNN